MSSSYNARRPMTFADIISILNANTQAALTNQQAGQTVLLNIVVAVSETVGETDSVSVTSGTDTNEWGSGLWNLMQWA